MIQLKAIQKPFGSADVKITNYKLSEDFGILPTIEPAEFPTHLLRRGLGSLLPILRSTLFSVYKNLTSLLKELWLRGCIEEVSLQQHGVH